MKTWSSEREWEVTIQPPTWWLAVCATSRGPDYQGWCTGQIYDCCLKHMTTGKNLCESLSLVWMSTVQEIQDGQKIISNSSASISRSRTARKNTMIFDIHQLSCSFLVTRKNVFVFFLVSGSETSLLTNFSFKRCILCFVFCFTWPSPDYQDFFSLPLKVFAKIFGLSIFPFRQSSEHYLGWGYLCSMNPPVALTPPTSSLAAGPALKHPRESFISSKELEIKAAIFLLYFFCRQQCFYCCLQNFKTTYIQHHSTTLNEEEIHNINSCKC